MAEHLIGRTYVIGRRYKINGTVCECIKVDKPTCDGCYYQSEHGCTGTAINCYRTSRKDKKNIILRPVQP